MGGFVGMPLWFPEGSYTGDADSLPAQNLNIIDSGTINFSFSEPVGEKTDCYGGDLYGQFCHCDRYHYFSQCPRGVHHGREATCFGRRDLFDLSNPF